MLFSHRTTFAQDGGVWSEMVHAWPDPLGEKIDPARGGTLSEGDDALTESKMHKTTPWDYWQCFVRGNYEDFAESPGDVRRGFNACVSAFSLVDIFYNYCERHDALKIAKWGTSTQLVKHLCAIDEYFITIQSVATVYKHLYPNADFYEVGSPGSLEGVAYRDIDIATEWADPPAVVVKRKDKSRILLQPALDSVVNKTWPNILFEAEGQQLRIE
jgi:hypothetical protein